MHTLQTIDERTANVLRNVLTRRYTDNWDDVRIFERYEWIGAHRVLKLHVEIRVERGKWVRLDRYSLAECLRDARQQILDSDWEDIGRWEPRCEGSNLLLK